MWHRQAGGLQGQSANLDGQLKCDCLARSIPNTRFKCTLCIHKPSSPPTSYSKSGQKSHFHESADSSMYTSYQRLCLRTQTPAVITFGCSIVIPVPGPGFRGGFWDSFESFELPGPSASLGPYCGPFSSCTLHDRNRPKTGPGSPSRGPEALSLLLLRRRSAGGRFCC